MEKITISKEEYKRLKKKEKIADDAIVQLKLSVKDIKEGKIFNF